MPFLGCVQQIKNYTFNVKISILFCERDLESERSYTPFSARLAFLIGFDSLRSYQNLVDSNLSYCYNMFLVGEQNETKTHSSRTQSVGPTGII